MTFKPTPFNLEPKFRLVFAAVAISFSFVIVRAAPGQSFSDSGLDPSQEITQYTLETWQRKEGLPQNSVHAILQTRDGYLWLGTQEGLARFDGVKFTVFNRRNTPQIKYNHINVLFESRNGALWIGTNGGGLIALKDQVFKSYTTQDGLSHDIVRTIYEDEKGGLWIGTIGGGLNYLFEAKIEVYTKAAGLLDNNITCMTAEASGNFLIGTKGGLSIYTNGRFSAHPLFEGIPFSIRTMIRDREGHIWIGTDGGGLFHLRNGHVSRLTKKEGLTSNKICWLYEDRAGSLWIGTLGGGLNRLFHGKISKFTRAQGLSNNDVQAIYEDREGNLWIGTNGGGLNRLINGKFKTYLAGEGVTQNFMWSLYRDRRDNLWASNDVGELLLYKDGQLTPSLPSLGNRITSICEDRTGALWLGTVNGLMRRTKGKLTFFPNVDGISNHVICVYEDKRGNIWIGTRIGLYRFSNGNFEHYPMNDGSSHNIIRALHEDREGNFWIGTFGGGLKRMRKGTFTAFTTRNGLSSNIAGPIYEDKEGTLWIGSIGGGLTRLKDGKFTAYTVAQGLYDDNVYAILEDEQENLWMSCNNGVFCVRRKDLNDFAAGKIYALTCKSFNEADGMKSSECNGGNQTSGAKTSEGKLWFPTTMGVVMVDPAAKGMNTVAPPAVIERVLIDKQTVRLADQIKIPPGRGELEFHYTALTFVTPQKVHFQYKLEPFDETWVEAGPRRAAYYTNILPGDYHFRVRASNDDRVWNEAEASFAFSLAPHFYQTLWFYFLVILAVALAAVRAHFLYRRYQERKLNAAQLEMRLAEAQLQVLKMQLQPHFLFNTLHAISSLMHKDVEAADEMMTRLGELLRVALESNGVQEVTLQQELEFLQGYLEIEQIRLGDRLHVQQEIQPETYNARVPNLILQPLVENAIRHGIAQRITGGRIEIGAVCAQDMLKITVCDDGPGLPAPLKEGVGLSNTRSRLQQIYGSRQQFSIATTSNGGVRVELEFPFQVENHEPQRPKFIGENSNGHR